MKNLFSFSLVFGLLLIKVQALTPQAILQGVTLAQNSERKLLGVQIIESLEEEAWYFQFQEPNLNNNYHWIKVHESQVLSDKVGFLPIFEGENLSSLAEDDLKMDLVILKKKAREIAKVAEVRPSQYHYCLKHPINRKIAYWQIILLNHQGESLGQLALNARTGKTMMASWKKNEEKKNIAPKKIVKSKTPKKKGGFGGAVEKTFRGIGADLEEFFTGERTVDKD